MAGRKSHREVFKRKWRAADKRTRTFAPRTLGFGFWYSLRFESAIPSIYMGGCQIQGESFGSIDDSSLYRFHHSNDAYRSSNPLDSNGLVVVRRFKVEIRIIYQQMVD